MNSKPFRFGDSIAFQAVSIVFAVCALVMLSVCWQASILLLLLAVAGLVYACCFAVTITADDRGLAFTRPRRELNTFYTWDQFSCLYRLVGVNRTLYLFSPARLTQDELRSIVRKLEKHRSSVPEIDGCLVVNYERGNKPLDSYIPQSIQRMPYSECISL